MSTFAIAGLQLELETADNVDLLCEEIRAVRARFPWLHMVVLPELSAFGVGVKHAQSMPGPAEGDFQAVARETGLWLLPGSFYESLNGAVFNTAPVIDPNGQVIARYRKMFPFLPYEKNVAAGEEFVTFDIDNVGRFGVSICYDMWFPETTRALACQGAEIILHPSLTNTIDRDTELSIVRANAAFNQCYFVDINCAGRLGYGRSIIAGPGGEVVHQAGPGREILPVELDLAHLRRVRERGTHGLGQTLKSFRDSQVRFPSPGAAREAAALARLGKLDVPTKDD